MERLFTRGETRLDNPNSLADRLDFQEIPSDSTIFVVSQKYNTDEMFLSQ